MKKIVLLNAGLFFFAALHAQQIHGVVATGAKTANRAADSLRKLLITKDTIVKKTPTKKPYQEASKKTTEKTVAKRND